MCYKAIINLKVSLVREGSGICLLEGEGQKRIAPRFLRSFYQENHVCLCTHYIGGHLYVHTYSFTQHIHSKTFPCVSPSEVSIAPALSRFTF